MTDFSAIWNFTRENFSRLRLLDYLLVLLIAAGLTYLAFLVLRWIYREVIASQKQVIELKDTTISTYKEANRSLSVEKAQLEREKTELATRVGALELHLHEVTNTAQRVSVLFRNCLVSQLLYSEQRCLFHQLALGNIVRSRLTYLVGIRHPGLKSEDAASFHKMLDESSDQITAISNRIDALAPNSVEDILRPLKIIGWDEELKAHSNQISEKIDLVWRLLPPEESS